jgi:hypothetical protein
MKARLAVFSLCSLSVHLLALSMLGPEATFEHGTTRSNDASALRVRIVASDPALQMRPREAVELQNPHLESLTRQVHASPAESTPVPTPVGPVAAQEYLQRGQLTRLPTPLSEIDLNAVQLGEMGFSGQLELVVMIDAEGAVVEVRNYAIEENARAFADGVAAHFRNARFTPGEVHGRPVRSQLRITVVSEHEASLRQNTDVGKSGRMQDD